MYKIYVGEISRSRLENWFCEDSNPYRIWDGMPLAETICIGSTWVTADAILRDRVDIDWGSIAWKANKNEILRLFDRCNLNFPPLCSLDPEKDYAVVFLETVWGDSV